MEKFATYQITPRIERELNVFYNIWRRGGEYTITTKDGTNITIPPSGDERDLPKWEKAKRAFVKASQRSAVNIKTQIYSTGEYRFIPLFVTSEDAVGDILNLLKTLVINNGPISDYHFIGTEIMEYDENYCVIVSSEVKNIPSAQRLITEFVKWVSTQIGAEVTTSNSIPLDGKYTQPRPLYDLGMHRVTEDLISSVTETWYNTEEKPIPPLWVSEINMLKEPDITDVFAFINDTPIIQRNGITLVSGAAKSGKTLLVSSMIASITGRDTILGITPGAPARILWCDTEQSENDLAVVRKRIEAMAGVRLNDADIKGLRLRPFGPEKSSEVIETTLSHFYPDVLIVDGPGDLCADTNDISASQITVKNLLRWCDEYDCAIVSVVHTNPGSEKTRGHIGSEIERKCAFSLMTAKNDAIDAEYPTFKVKPGFMRGKSFKPYSFRYNEDGLPELVGEVAAENPKNNAEDIILSEMDRGFRYSYSQLIRFATAEGIGEGTAKSAISRLISKRKINKGEDGYFV